MASAMLRLLVGAVRPLLLVATGLFLTAWASRVAADEIADPVGDILPTYTGPYAPGMDVVAHQVTLAGDRVIFYGRMDGPIAPTQAFGGLYLFGIDRGLGTPRFLGPAAPPVIGPNVVWDSILRINPDGTGLFNNVVAGIVTPLDRADIVINDNEFVASVPLSLLSPAATRPPCEWTYNLWPRNGIGRNVQVSDLAPDDGNSPFQSLPEVVCTSDRSMLWPPNHTMVEVQIVVEVLDPCAPPEELLLWEVIVRSNEPDDALGDEDGDTTGDTDGGDGFTAPVDVTGNFVFNPLAGRYEGSIMLRAERNESQAGRRYQIEATVINPHLNMSIGRCEVWVPLNRSR